MGTIGALAIEGLLIGGLIGRFSGRFQNKTSCSATEVSEMVAAVDETIATAKSFGLTKTPMLDALRAEVVALAA